MANYGSGGVSVLLGCGDGSFQVEPSLGAGLRFWSVAAGDFNGGGAPDVAVANQASGDVSVLINNARR
jgi:hypothetical protein